MNYRFAGKFLRDSAHGMPLVRGSNINHHNKIVSFMMSLIRFGLTRDEVKKCAIKSFSGRVFVINSENDQYKREIQNAINLLIESPVIGFDTESKVDFTNQGSGPNQLPISLIQLSTEDVVILWRLRKEGKLLQKQFPRKLHNILSNKNIAKVGTGNTNDISDLYSYYNVIISNVIDNQTMAKKLGFHRIGLESLAAQLFNWRVSKARSKRLSNWEARELNFDQVIYAATDAWASLKVYEKLSCMTKTLSNESVDSTSSYGSFLLFESEVDHRLLKVLEDKMVRKSAKYDSFYNMQQKKNEKVNHSMDDLHLEKLIKIIDFLRECNNIEHEKEMSVTNLSEIQSEVALASNLPNINYLDHSYI